MANRMWQSPVAPSVALVTLFLSVACDAGGGTGPDGAAPTPTRIAYVQVSGPGDLWVPGGVPPALFVQPADGSGQTQIHFAGARELPGNSDILPGIFDVNLLAIGPISWSPDGRRLAVVVTVAYDQSEIVVLDADGGNARVASPNTQIIMTAPEWSPDGTRLAYGMSTLPGAGGVQLFVTDLGAENWRQVTSAAPIGSSWTDVRWSGGGTVPIGGGTATMLKILNAKTTLVDVSFR